jgi:hypothetical protein
MARGARCIVLRTPAADGAGRPEGPRVWSDAMGEVYERARALLETLRRPARPPSAPLSAAEIREVRITSRLALGLPVDDLCPRCGYLFVDERTAACGDCGIARATCAS